MNHLPKNLHLPWQKQAWIFDLDGTLTRAILDFPTIKRQLGLPPDRGILESIRHLQGERLAAIEEQLTAWEREAVRNAQPAEGAADLLNALRDRRKKLGILTRNKRDHALETLANTGLADFFDPDNVVGRDEAEPKPNPAGLLKLLERWQVQPSAACFIGDDGIDVQTGKACGVITVHLTLNISQAEVSVKSLPELIASQPKHHI